MFPSALPAVRETSYNAWVTIQIGCDNHCAFCIVPAVRGVEISRPFDDIVAEVRRARRGRRHRDHAARPERQQLRPRPPAGGPARRRRRGAHPAAVRRPAARATGAVEGIRRVRFTSPHPKDMRPETFAAMAETPAVCPQLHYPLQAGSDRVLAAMHRGYTAARYLERLAEARRTVPDLAVSTDIIVGFPGETDDDFEQTMEVAADGAVRRRLHVHLLAPPRHRGGDDGRRDFVDPDVAGERFRRLRVVDRAQRAGRQRGARRSRRGGARRRARARRTRPMLAARTPHHRLVHFAPPRRCAPARTRPSRSPAPPRTTSPGASSTSSPRPTHRTRIPVAAL